MVFRFVVFNITKIISNLYIKSSRNSVTNIFSRIHASPAKTREKCQHCIKGQVLGGCDVVADKERKEINFR